MYKIIKKINKIYFVQPSTEEVKNTDLGALKILTKKFQNENVKYIFNKKFSLLMKKNII